jgi:hypothetical protein
MSALGLVVDKNITKTVLTFVRVGEKNSMKKALFRAFLSQLSLFCK